MRRLSKTIKHFIYGSPYEFYDDNKQNFDGFAQKCHRLVHPSYDLHSEKDYADWIEKKVPENLYGIKIKDDLGELDSKINHLVELHGKTKQPEQNPSILMHIEYLQYQKREYTNTKPGHFGGIPTDNILAISKNKRLFSVIFDWDKTLSICEGFMSYSSDNPEQMKKDTVRYLLGLWKDKDTDASRYDLVKEMFKSLIENNTYVFILTNNSSDQFPEYMEQMLIDMELDQYLDKRFFVIQNKKEDGESRLKSKSDKFKQWLSPKAASLSSPSSSSSSSIDEADKAKLMRNYLDGPSSFGGHKTIRKRPNKRSRRKAYKKTRS